MRATGHLAFLYIRTVTSPPLGFQRLSPAGARRAAAVRARLRSCEHRRRGVCVYLKKKKNNNNARVLKVARNYQPHFSPPDAYIWIKPLHARPRVFFLRFVFLAPFALTAIVPAAGHSRELLIVSNNLRGPLLRITYVEWGSLVNARHFAVCLAADAIRMAI